MNKTTKIVIGAVLVVALAVLAFIIKGNNQTSSTTEKPLTLGLLLPLTGTYAAFGEEFKRGAELAAHEISNIELVIEDSRMEPSPALSAAKKIIGSNDVDAMITSAYTDASTTWKLFEKEEIPTVILWDSNKATEDMGDTVFAMGSWMPASGEVTAQFLYNDLGIRSVVTLPYNHQWSLQVADAFENEFTKLGGKVLYREATTPNTKDFKSTIQKLVASNAEAVYFPTDAVLALPKQLSESNFKGIKITSDVLDNELVKNNPAIYENVYTSQVADADTVATSRFIKNYKEYYGFEPKKLMIAAWGYDGVMFLNKAAASGDRKLDLIKTIYEMDEYQGATGAIKFSAEGSSKIIPKMFVITNGNYKLVESKK